METTDSRPKQPKSVEQEINLIMMAPYSLDNWDLKEINVLLVHLAYINFSKLISVRFLIKKHFVTQYESFFLKSLYNLWVKRSHTYICTICNKGKNYWKKTLFQASVQEIQLIKNSDTLSIFLWFINSNKIHLMVYCQYTQYNGVFL